MTPPHIIRRISGPYHLNTYILVCRRTREAVMIDPGGPEKELIEVIRGQGITLKKILNTHGHADQFFSTKVFKKTYPVPSCLHSEDDLFFRDPAVQEKTMKSVGLPPPFPADIELSDRDRIRFGKTELTVIHTPGHTPGSVCFLCEGHLFTGDALFIGEAGRTDLPGGNLDQLIASIKTRILPLDKATVIHPGHHHGEAFESTIEREMTQNIYITDFILDE